MNDSALSWLYDMAKKREWTEIALGDTLDVKASIMLTIVALVAGITGVVLAWTQLPLFRILETVQVISVFLLSASALLAIAALSPKNYEYEDTPDAYAGWLQRLEQFYAPRQVTETVIKDADFAEVSRRFHDNQQLNVHKSQYLFWSFWLLVPSVVAALGSLVFMAFHLLYGTGGR
jgi:hypothetical protein